MIDPFYNGILLAIILIWLAAHKTLRMGRLIKILKEWGWAFSLLFWAVFVCFASWYVLSFDHFAEIHDIDDATNTAVNSVSDGINPYEEYIIPRFKDKFSPTVDWTLGPYNYMPLDLLVYVAAEKAFGFLGAPGWFVVVNMLFSGIAMFLLRNLTRTSYLPFIPIAGTVMLFYSMDNASLTLALMVASIYMLERGQDYPEAYAILLMGLAVLTKIYAAIPFLVMLIFMVQSNLSRREYRRLTEVLLSTSVVAALAVLVMLPFGISNVLDAAVFFHTSESAREGTSAGGTILAEVAIDSGYFSLIGAGVTLIAVLVGLWVRNLNDRVMLVIVAFLLIAVKSSLAPLTVAGVFLALRIRELVDERTAASLRAEGSIERDVPEVKGEGTPAER